MMRYQNLKARIGKMTIVAMVSVVGVIAIGGCTRPYHVSKTEGRPAYKITSATASDPATETLIAPFRAQLINKLSFVLGIAPVTLKADTVESSLGNFVADACLQQAQQFTKQPIATSLVAKGGLRSPIYAGNVKVSDIFELMPFENELVVINLKGSTLQNLFLRFGQDTRLSMSNCHIEVSNRQLVSATINGLPVDTSKYYMVATSDYIAGGGDKLALVTKNAGVTNTHLKMRDALMNYCTYLTTNQKQITATVEGRVIRK